MGFDYKMMVPPMTVPSFEEMTSGEARAHFDWFTQQADRRIDLLKGAYAHEIGSPADLDESRNSLVPLWRWLSRYAKERPLSQEEARQLQSQLPQWVRNAGVTAGELSSVSLALAVDAGFYFAKIFLKAYPEKVTWTLWDRRGDHYYNRPVLTGFGAAPLLPHELIINATWGVIHGRMDEKRLAKIYDVWARKLDR